MTASEALEELRRVVASLVANRSAAAIRVEMLLSIVEGELDDLRCELREANSRE